MNAKLSWKHTKIGFIAVIERNVFATNAIKIFANYAWKKGITKSNLYSVAIEVAKEYAN